VTEQEDTNMSSKDVTTEKNKLKLLTQAFVEMGIILADFTGSVTFHFNSGGVTEIERYEKCLKRLLSSDIRLSR
jgi:hypothetical protein